MYCFAEHGDAIWLKSRYVDIYERASSKGTMLMVVIESAFLDKGRTLTMRFRKTQIRR